MKLQTYTKAYIFILSLCLTLTACGTIENEKTSYPEEITQNLDTEKKENSNDIIQIEAQENDSQDLESQETQLPDLYQQIALYLQEGFRKYNIEGVYQLYFEYIDESKTDNYCTMLLEGDKSFWEERISYTYDEESKWYTFRGQYEPIFAKADYLEKYENSSFVTEMKENYIYQTQISKYTDIPASIHYVSDQGPVEKDEIWFLSPYEQNGFTYDMREELPYFIQPNLYSYLDDRLGVDITIEYMKIISSDDEMDTLINNTIKKAFFYGYDTSISEDEVEALQPETSIYTTITRQYYISRADEDYLSIRIYEYNDSRLANHPNEWETGITIDMHTGEVLHLKDIIGEDWTPAELLRTGAFNTDWIYSDWIGQLKEDIGEKNLSDYDSYFYITDKNLGLVTFLSRYYACIEADLKELNKIHPLPICQ